MMDLIVRQGTAVDELLPAEMFWRLSLAQYQQMIETGFLTEADPVEFLQGWLVQKMPKTPRHSTVTRLIRLMLEQLVPDGWYVDSQEPITTLDSEPEPDLVVVRGAGLNYLQRHPQAAEVGIVVEVSDATLSRDRNLKKRLYAAANIPVYWIVNLQDNQIEVYTHPDATATTPDYGQRQTYYLGETMPVWLEDKRLGDMLVASLLPS